MTTQLIAILGAGGVGKTTTSAALGLALADQGYRVVVITVDPARRLAQALGLESLSNQPQTVFENLENSGRLEALWLEPQSALKELVQKSTSSLEEANFILENRLFKILQSQLGGIEEYLGVEKLLTLKRLNKFHFCILDTPPSRHAIDFIESPKHILKFFDESILKFFMSDQSGNDEKQNSGPAAFFKKLLSVGRNQALDLFRNFLGRTFLTELAVLLTRLKPLHKHFTQTAEEIEKWVTDPETNFVLVAAPEKYPVLEAKNLSNELRIRDLAPPALWILNRGFPESPAPTDALLGQKLNSDQIFRIKSKLASQIAIVDGIKTDLTGTNSKLVTLTRFSVRQLTRDQLMILGREILKTWKPKSKAEK